MANTNDASANEITRKPWTVMIYMIADDPAGGELLDQQANRELDEIIYATLGGDREHERRGSDGLPESARRWRRLVGEGTGSNPKAPRPIHRRCTASSIGSRNTVRPTDTS